VRGGSLCHRGVPLAGSVRALAGGQVTTAVGVAMLVVAVILIARLAGGSDE